MITLQVVQCHQASIRNQGTSAASITLSPDAFGVASLNVGASKGGKKPWWIALFCPHRQVHGRVSRPYVTYSLPHGRVVRPCVPCT
ncbi:3-(3-hydroxy-phenyl)propionate/3-hydroxycinnamic acid hydroxylase [Gossypium arboreum]|uniref:3-(3-hydroxy-phenyl)propionate/3-hydroxycinnamic acid hydroxylase n=1 Tax=Gossypium arboreum TaxID=29729 RepID=A0A0B0NKU7_GOSAR|nr:3-(3-hydroxy-phenyl)propionate/3-hydroxycinnamic acid hydroxylase [Gossypium arboreum]